MKLESSTNYDDRRKIRERIRQVMADKEGKNPLLCVFFCFNFSFIHIAI